MRLADMEAFVQQAERDAMREDDEDAGDAESGVNSFQCCCALCRGEQLRAV